MESQKIKTLLDHKENTYPKYQTKRWYIINDQNNGNYPDGNTNDKSVKIDTEVVKPFLCDYADAYILVTGDIAVTRGNNNTKVAFKNCHPLTNSKIHSNDEHIEDSDNFDVIMNMYNFIEYSGNFSDSTASLYHFKRQEQSFDDNNPVNITALSVDNSTSFKCKSGLINVNSVGINENVNPNIP